MRQRHTATLDAGRHHQRIAFDLGAYEFPWDFETALSLALFRTFASPTISGLLAATGEFERRPQKRYDDTELLLAEIIEHGYDSDRGRAAIRRINRMHGAYDISSEDMLYVMSTFVLEPIRWAQRFGWRTLTVHESEAMMAYWAELGPRLMVRGIPGSLEELDAFNRTYESQRVRYAPSNAAVADASLEAVLRRLPPPLRGLGRQVVMSLLDPHIRRAFGEPDPPLAVQVGVDAALRTRATVLRDWVPERRRPFLLTAREHETYPDGYEVEELGT